MSVESWRRHWEGLTAFFKYPVEFRRLIYTTNAIESLHSQMRKNIASRKMFPGDDAVIKILFLNIRNFSTGEQKEIDERNALMTTNRRGSEIAGHAARVGDIAMNQLGVMFGDRLKPEIADGM
jgi:putative transposase